MKGRKEKKGFPKYIVISVIAIIGVLLVLWALMGREKPVGEFGKKISLEEAVEECRNLAISDPFSYCTSIYSIDINNDGKYSSVIYTGKGNTVVCESSLFCYSLVDNIMGDRCIIELCSRYIYEKGMNPEEATLKTFGYYYVKGVNSKSISAFDLEEFKSAIFEFEKMKSRKEGETGYIFIGPNCDGDDVVYLAWMNIGRMILNNAIGSATFTLGIHPYENKSYGYLYINYSDLKDGIKSELRNLYGDKIPEAVPLCAVLIYSI
ncbi:hypothetical protein BA065_02240 [Nanoarchaeota archaeon NZ13-N]|nr:MAG: hypothetical protein BA065_02240 [Nanoarchaeota archaeon NZ13-N]